MEERSEYQVLAPDSVAWYIQAALVADRTGNVTARDVALSEAQRIAQERRLSERSYDCRTTEERLAVQEDRLQILSDTMRRIVAELDQRVTEQEAAIQADIRERIEDRRRLDALEAAAAPAVANRAWMDEIEQRLAALEAWQIAVAQDGEGDDTLFRIYDAINRAERAKAAGGA